MGRMVQGVAFRVVGSRQTLHFSMRFSSAVAFAKSINHATAFCVNALERLPACKPGNVVLHGSKELVSLVCLRVVLLC